jgi:hypothetical protein
MEPLGRHDGRERERPGDDSSEDPRDGGAAEDAR